MKRVICLILLVAVVLSTCSCGSDTEIITTVDEPYILPTTVIDTDISLPYTSSDSFDPYKAKSNYNRDLITVIYESVFIQTADGKGEKLLASSATVEDKSVTVTILSGVKFSDGTVLTAEHIKSSFDKAAADPYYKDALSNVSSVSVVDGLTVRFTLYRADALVLNTLDFPVVITDGDAVLGTGKYYVGYLDDVPYLEVNSLHRDYAARWNKQIALYDMAGISSPIYPFKANEISIYRNELNDGNYNNLSSVTVSENMNNLVYIGFNSAWAGTVVSNSWLRKAINIGIDREDVAASSFLGQTSPCSSFYREESCVLEGVDRVGLGGNIADAVRILEDNGYSSVNGQGIRTNGNNELRVTVLVCTENQYKLNVAEAVKKSLETLGIGVTVIEKENIEDYTAALEEGYFDLYIGETRLTPNCELGEFFSAEGTLNYGISEDFYENYLLFDNGDITVAEFVGKCNEFVPVAPLFYRKSIVSVNPNISGLNRTSGILYGINNWTVEES